MQIQDEQNIKIINKGGIHPCTCATWPLSPHPDLSSEIEHYLQNEAACLGGLSLLM